MHDPSVSVIVPTCGRDDLFVACLGSLRRQSCPPAEVILVNNAIDADIERKARATYPTVKIINPEKNLYYGASLNLGIAESRGEFVLCLNDDATLEDGFVKEATKGFEVSDRVGMVSGKVLRPDHRTLDTTGLFLSVFRTAHERGYGRLDRGQFEKAEFIFGVGGAVAFYRRTLLESIKDGASYFDPSFRMFYEDLDLAWRAHRVGWKAYYQPSAVAYHARGGSVRQRSGLGKSWARGYLNDEFHSDLIQNRYRAILKNETLLGFCLHLIPMLLHELCAWGYVLFFRPKVLGIIFSGRKTQGVREVFLRSGEK